MLLGRVRDDPGRDPRAASLRVDALLSSSFETGELARSNEDEFDVKVGA